MVQDIRINMLALKCFYLFLYVYRDEIITFKNLAKKYLYIFIIISYSSLKYFCLDDDKNVERMDKLKDHMQENEVRMKKV